MGSEKPMHVLIAGGGIVGLTIAQGCRENGISYTLFERDLEESRRKGWGLTLHWCLDVLERTIGPERAAKLSEAAVDPALNEAAGKFLFLNAETGKARYEIAPSRRRLRLDREKLRQILIDGIDIHEGKKLTSFEVLEDGIRANFEDGTYADGTILIGADGNKSRVRRQLLPNGYALTPLPVNLVGVVRHFSADQGKQVRKIDPLLFQALHPTSSNFLWYSIQDVATDPDDRAYFDALIIVSWIMKDPSKDAIPGTDRERIGMMKYRARDFAEPLRSMVMDIPDDLDSVIPLTLGDWPCVGWDNKDGRVTLAGDAAHAMTMYRGEGANHGVLDSALLVDQLKRIHQDTLNQKLAIDEYEAEMRPRTHAAVLKSRAAALVAHEWDQLTEDSAVIEARIAPLSALKSPFV